jgi:hypothetical protein
MLRYRERLLDLLCIPSVQLLEKKFLKVRTDTSHQLIHPHPPHTQ